MKSNIIFIIVDTLRADALGAMFHVNQLACKGALFDNAYASTTKTDPSISSIFSAKYPQSIGLISHGQWISQKEEKNIKKAKFLPEILQAKGYRTIAVDWLSRWHARGYDDYSAKIVPDARPEDLIVDRFFYLKYLRKIDRLFLIRAFKRDFCTRLAFSSLLNYPIPYDPADVVVDQAIAYLKKANSRPFFLYLHFWDPHWPHFRPQGWRSFLFDTVVDRYLAEVKFVDEHLARFFQYLEEKKLLDKTLIVFTADHGESLIEHDLFMAHQGLYEQVVKVPLFFYHYQFKPKKIKTLVAHVDIVPTILDFLKITPREDIDGKTLFPLILGKTKKVRDFVFFEDVVFGQMRIKEPKRRRGIRKGNYKYLQYLAVDNENISQLYLGPKTAMIFEELFDLKKDPQEKKNLASLKIKEKEGLKKILLKHIEELK